MQRTVREIGQPSAASSPPGAAGAFPPNKGKAVARLSTAPRSGSLPLPLHPHTRSPGETRPEIPFSPPRGGGRKGTGGSGRLAPGPLPAPHRAEELGPQFLYLGANPHQRHQVSTDIFRHNLSAPRASCRLIQHSCGSARHQRSAVQTSWPAHLWHRSSKVEFNLAAIPPHLRRSEPRRKCSGRPGRWRRECQPSLR